MQIPIPSWVIALSGSCLVVISTAVGTTHLTNLDAQKIKISNDIVQREAEFRETYDNHKLADQKATTADLLAGLVAQNLPVHPDKGDGYDRFIVPRAARYILDAICVMRSTHQVLEVCGDEKLSAPEHNRVIDQNPDEIRPMPSIATLYSQLQSGDLDSFDALVNILSYDRNASASKLNEQKTHIAQREKDRAAVESKLTTYRTVQVSLNLLGLVIVLLKDLPIWRNTASDTG